MPPAPVVLLGASGFTGRLTAAVLARRGAPLVLAGRDPARLDAVRRECAPAAGVRRVDLADPRDLDGLLRPGEVLVTTAGPFLRLGLPVARRAAREGWAYVDSTGEPPFVRALVDELGGAAVASGARLVPAAGYDYLPGNLAAGLALADATAAGRAASAVRVGYFLRGRATASGGTLASAAGVLVDAGYAWRGGRLVPERPASRVLTLPAGGRQRRAVTIAGSEHLFLPRTAPELRDVEVGLGWAGPWSRGVALGSAALGAAVRLPGVRDTLGGALARLGGGRGGGPEAPARAGVRSLVVAEALAEPGGEVLAHVEMEGPSPYDLTAELLAAVALALGSGEIAATGVLGPLEALGLAGLEALAADVGLVRTG